MNKRVLATLLERSGSQTLGLELPLNSTPADPENQSLPSLCELTVAAKPCHSSTEKSQGFSPEAAGQLRSQKEVAKAPGLSPVPQRQCYLQLSPTKENSLHSRKSNVTYCEVSKGSFISAFATRRLSSHFLNSIFYFP